ncbi:MAG: HAD-IIA family hydrolase [Spirochaetales bacterium]|nr:HAD-IIA family hydrolase [Spirochaetales bacterium]
MALPCLADHFDGVIFDVDGVLEYQGKAYPGAREFLEMLRRQGKKIRILTNSTLKSRKVCAERLRAKGLAVEDSEVITASFATAEYLRRKRARSCWVLLKGEGREEFSDLMQDQEHPEFLVLGDCRDEFNFDQMNRALRLLLEGARLVVMIPERIDSSLGSLELTVGAYGRMLEEATRQRAVYVGKPNRAIFAAALRSMGVRPKRKVLMVGDKVSTDILGARRIGIPSALIRTGEYREGDLDSRIQPDYTFDSIQDLARAWTAGCLAGETPGAGSGSA